MGTFHQGKSELHGFTFVVDTTGEEIFIGRCDDETGEGIILLDVDVHRDGEGGRSKEDYVKRAAMAGTWKKHDALLIPRDRIASVRKLGEM